MDRLKAKCATLESEIRDPARLKDFYQFAFNYAKNPGQKCLGKHYVLCFPCIHCWDCWDCLSECVIVIELWFTPGVGKVRPVGQIQPASSVHLARGGLSVLTLNSAGKMYDERLFSHWAWFSRILIVNDDRLSYTYWRVGADWLPLHLTLRSLTSLMKLGHFWRSWKKIVKSWKLVELILKQSWTKYQKPPHFLSVLLQIWHDIMIRGMG